MENLFTNAPQAEQAICVHCGFCCDGTLFLHAVLQPGEKGNLPDKIEQQYYLDEDGEFFKMPCPYFCEKCTIYKQKKAEVCSSFRCQLLKNFATGKISSEEALALVHNAAITRDELIRDFNRLNPNHEVSCFRKLLLHLGSLPESPDNQQTANNKQQTTNDILTARCNILEAQLIRYFRSVEEFDQLVMGGR